MFRKGLMFGMVTLGLLALIALMSCVAYGQTTMSIRRVSTLPATCSELSSRTSLVFKTGTEAGIYKCVGGVYVGESSRLYDPAYTSPNLTPATTRFTVGSTTAQTIPAANSFIGSDFYSAITPTHTSGYNYAFGLRNTLAFVGTPTGQSNITGLSTSVVSGNPWSPGVLDFVTGVNSNVDIGSGASGINNLIGARFRAHVGSVNVSTVGRLVGVEAVANAGYASVVTDLVGVQASTSSVSDFGGSTTNVKLFHATKSTTNSDVTNFYAFYAGNYGGGSAPITNNYGLFLDSTIDQGTNRWAIVSESVAPSRFHGKLSFDATYTAGGTTGAQTINKPAFSVNFAAAATSLVVTNSFVTNSSTVGVCTVQTNDTTMKTVSFVAGTGSVTLHANAAATGETKVYCEVKN